MERPQTSPKYVHVIQQVKAEAQVTSKRIVFVEALEVALQPYHAKVDLDFRFAQNHTLSLWRICLHDWRLIFHDLRRIGSK